MRWRSGSRARVYRSCWVRRRLHSLLKAPINMAGLWRRSEKELWLSGRMMTSPRLKDSDDAGDGDCVGKRNGGGGRLLNDGDCRSLIALRQRCSRWTVWNVTDG